MYLKVSLDKYRNMWNGKPSRYFNCENHAKKEFNCIHGFFCSKECMEKFHEFAEKVIDLKN